jgi:alanine racemase
LGLKNYDWIESEISILLTDSRQLSNPSETLFFAFETKNNDGHRYIADLYAAGVRNFVVSKMMPEWKNFSGCNFLFVKSPLRALQKIAAYHRRRFDIPVIGITGSNGKTTCERMALSAFTGRISISSDLLEVQFADRRAIIGWAIGRQCYAWNF